MKTYYRDNHCTIIHGTAAEAFPTIPLPDVVIADPPYGETKQKWDRWPADWPDLLTDVPSFWCFGTMRMFQDHAAEFANFHLAQDLVWEKQNGTGLHNDRFRKVHELICQYYPLHMRWSEIHHEAVRIPHAGRRRTIIRHQKPAHWGKAGTGSYQDNGTRLMRSVMRAKNGHRTGNHANAKPLSILRALIQYSCPPNGTVVSLFMGGGNDLIAARELGRRAIGIEADEATCEATALRLQQQHLPT